MPSMLLVTDADWVRNDVAGSVTDPRWTIEHTDDPRLVATLADREEYGLYLVDLQVGSMGGMAITRRLKDAMAVGDVPPAPIVLLLDRQADTFLARRAGADAWLVKPFTAQALRMTMAELQTGSPA